MQSRVPRHPAESFRSTFAHLSWFVVVEMVVVCAVAAGTESPSPATFSRSAAKKRVEDAQDFSSPSTINACASRSEGVEDSVEDIPLSISAHALLQSTT